MVLNLNVKEKLLLALGLLVTMIVALVVLSVFSLQILTATEPDAPAAEYGLNRAMSLVIIFGALCIFIGLWILFKLPKSVSRPFMKLSDAINEIANHNYDVSIDLKGSTEMEHISSNFNRMAKRLSDYHNSSMTALMAANRYLETIINSIDEPIVCIDKQINILFVNNAALSVLNLTADMAVGKPANQLALRNDLLRRLINGLNDAHGQSKISSVKDAPLKIYADNKECYFAVKYLPVRLACGVDGASDVEGSVILLNNITEFHKLDVAKTTFIATISHELKTPLSSILMSLQLLNDRRVGDLNEEQRSLSDGIKDNCDRLLSIIGELLNITQVESGALQLKPHITKPIELIEYAIKANRVQADKFDINIEVDYPTEKIGKLYIDSEKIAWVVTNLLSNAIRYSSAGSRVVIGANQPDSKHITIYVQDFGKGIDPRYHESIFERYFRVPGTKVQGSGLGLSISRDFVEAHNGTLTVDSQPGKGSCFIMTLPI